MPAGLEGMLVALVEDLLDPLEHLPFDQGLVFTGMFDTSVADQAEVVPVAQQLGELG